MGKRNSKKSKKEAQQKNADISNKALAGLLLVGIFLSLLTFSQVLHRGTGGSSASNMITGMFPVNTTNQTGNVSFAVESNILLNITDSTINFGDVEVGDTNTSETEKDWFNITNDGTVNIDVSAYGVGSPFTSSGASTLPNNNYFVHANSSQSGTINTTYVSVPANASTKKLLITALDKDTGLDKAAIGIKIIVPSDEDAGSKAASLVLLAEQTP